MLFWSVTSAIKQDSYIHTRKSVSLLNGVAESWLPNTEGDFIAVRGGAWGMPLPRQGLRLMSEDRTGDVQVRLEGC